MDLIRRRKELKGTKVALIEEATATLDRAAKATRDLTPEERQRDDAIQAQVKEINLELADIERTLLADRDVDAPPAQIGRPGMARYAQLFGAARAQDTGGWSSFEEYLSVLDSGRHHPGLRAAGPMTTGIGSEGGYTVPSAFLARLLDVALESEIVRPRAVIYPMRDAPSMRVPIMDGFDTSTGKPYGYSGQWLAEGAEATTEKGRTQQLLMTARSLAIYTEMSNELAADGIGFEAQLEKAITKAAAWCLDAAFIGGNGAGQPLGMYGGPATIVVAKEGGQLAATINYTNLTKMFARLHPSCLKNAIWLANPTTIPQLATLTIAIGAGGAHVPVLSEQNGQFTILTRPVIFTEKVPALGTQGDIGLVDFSQYAIALRADAALDKSQHVGWTRRTTGYRLVLRCDGQPLWPAATSPKNGDSQSCCVVLATRS